MSATLACRLVGALLLAISLAGCIDAKVDVHVTSMTTAKAVVTQVMGPQFYAMFKSNQTGAGASTDDEQFCAKGKLTEHSDGSATCILAEEGAFADLHMGHDKRAITFTPAGPGLVRVALQTAELKGEAGIDDTMGPETREMVEAFFKDRAITLHFSGLAITDTNMVLSADKTSAEQVIPFVDVIDGTADLPKELYAVVRVQ